MRWLLFQRRHRRRAHLQPGTEPGGYSSRHEYAGRNTDFDTNTYTYGNADGNIYTYRYPYSNRNADGNSYRDTNSYGYIHANTYADSHSYVHTNPHCDSYTNRDTNRTHATATPTANQPTPTPPAGLVAAYNFNQGSGTTVTDASGNGITGNIIGATWTTGGRNGNALSFNGSSSYVDLGNPALLQITGSMTWSAWVKAAANPPDDGQIMAKSNNASGWQFKTSPDTGPHTFGVGVAGATNTFAQRYSTTVRSLNVWYHVAGVYNASARTLDIYVNGVLNNGTLSGTVPASQINSAVNVNIGRRSGRVIILTASSTTCASTTGH